MRRSLPATGREVHLAEIDIAIARGTRESTRRLGRHAVAMERAVGCFVGGGATVQKIEQPLLEETPCPA